MRIQCRLSLLSAAIVAGLLVSVVQLSAQQEQNPTAVALAAFTKRVNAYMDLHKKAEQGAPDVTKGATPAEVLVFEKALGDRIKAARSTAQQGDLFAPDVAPL